MSAEPYVPPTMLTSKQLGAELAGLVRVRNQHEGTLGLPTTLGRAIPEFDDLLQPGSLITFCGYSGGGKTTAGAQTALEASVNAFGHVITLEDPATSITERWVANLGDLPVSDIRRGWRGKSVPLQFDQAIERLGNLPLTAREAKGASIWRLLDEIDQACNAHRGQFGVLVLDQLSEVFVPYGELDPREEWVRDQVARLRWPAPPGSRAPEHKQLEWIVGLLEVAAKSYGICIINNHQLNNAAAEGQKPTVRSVRSSQGIVHKSEAVIIWYTTPHLVLPNPVKGPGEPPTIKVPNTEGRAWIIGCKNRYGKQFEAEVQFDGEHQRFVLPGNLGKSVALPAVRTEAQKASAGRVHNYLAELRNKRRQEELAAAQHLAIQARSQGEIEE